MSLTVPPSTGVKKKARRVFGDAVAEDDQQSSLSYSPSPRKADTVFSGSAEVSALVQRGLVHTMERNEEINSDKNDVLSLVSLEKENSFACNIEKKNVDCNHIKHAKLSQTENQQQQITLRERFLHLSMQQQQQRSPILHRDLVQKTQDAITKASRSVAAAQKEHPTFQWRQQAAQAKTLAQYSNKNRLQLLQLQRQLSSQYSRDRAARKQEEKQQSMQQLEEESEFKSQVWRDQQLTLRQLEVEQRRRSLATRAQVRDSHRRGKEWLLKHKREEEQIILVERYESSLAQRHFAEQQTQRRRRSFAFRKGDAQRIRHLHAQMVSDNRRALHEDYKLKWESEKDAEEYKRKVAQNRRESMAQRNREAKRLCDLEQQQKSERLLAEHEDFELKWKSQKDVEVYQRRMQQDRRHSLVKRNRQAYQQRQLSQEEHFRTLAQQHESNQLRWDSDKDMRDYHHQLATQRRESLVRRGEEAQHHRELEQKHQSKRMQNENASYELKWASEQDAKDYQNELEENRRLSLVGRKLDAQRRRLEMEQEKALVQDAEHASYEVKWAADRDAEDYQRKLEQQRRQSLAHRNQEAKRLRDLEQRLVAEKIQREHESYEVKWAGEADTVNYQLQMNRARRESLARRNTERAQHAIVMKELRALAHEHETESYVLKWAGDSDANEYHVHLKEEHRKSLQQRGKVSAHHRKIQSDQRQHEIDQLHKNEVVRAIDQKDVNAYRNECSERDRRSLEYRRKETHVQRIQDDERRLQQREIDEKNFDLELQANRDVQAYIGECKQRRRMSLALRAKEQRQHVQWKEKQRIQEQYQRSQQIHDNLMDQHHSELARQQERAKLALDALRHAGCSFGFTNPFADLLKY